MERAIIYYAKTGLEATDHFVPKLLEKYCQDNGYEIVAMLSEPASTEGVSFPMKYAIIGLNMEEDVNTIITLSKDMIGATDETVIDTLGKLSEYDIYVEDINGELEECYEMMYKEPVQESDIRGWCLIRYQSSIITSGTADRRQYAGFQRKAVSDICKE